MILSDISIYNRLDELVEISKSENTTLQGLSKQVNPNSIDLTISRIFKRGLFTAQRWNYGFKNQQEASLYNEKAWESCRDEDYILMKPGDVVLACTREYIKMPKDICGQLFTKSTLGRMFINHMMAGVIDAGFEGRLTLELVNEGVHYIRIPIGARVVQMVLMGLDLAAIRPYGNRESRYHEAMSVECAKLEDSFNAYCAKKEMEPLPLERK